jgi:uncharacterized membrane protein
MSYSHASEPNSATIGGQIPLQIRRLTIADIGQALRAGLDDLRHFRTDALLLAALFPVSGLLLAGVFVIQGFLPLVFPLLSGFALLGPVATLWFAAQSRQRERGDESATTVFKQPRLKAIQRLASIEILIFLVWNAAAGAIYYFTLGSSNENAGANFLVRVLTTTAGWEMTILGCAVGAAFAFLTLAISCISFPLVIDRSVTASVAISASLRAISGNPVFVLAWGAIVAIGLVVGTIPCLLGLVFVLPVLGHATWHIYRRMIV